MPRLPRRERTIGTVRGALGEVRLRADPVTASIPILAVTGDCQLAAGADAVLAKPYRPQEIMAAAAALLSQEEDRT